MPVLDNPKHEPAPQGFYVYELIDPRSGNRFYVGKGKGRRAWVHERAERCGKEKNALKAEVLGQIRRAGLRPTIQIIKEGLTEDEALRLERSIIVKNHKTLTNISLGERSELERVRAHARASLAEMKPLCVVLKEGADRARLKLWADIISSFARFSVAGLK